MVHQIEESESSIAQERPRGLCGNDVKADAQDDYADIGALEVSAYTPQRGTFGKDSAVVNRRIRKDGITTIENIQLSIAKSAYNQAEFVTLFVRGSDGQWSVGVARFKRVR